MFDIIWDFLDMIVIKFWGKICLDRNSIYKDFDMSDLYVFDPGKISDPCPDEGRQGSKLFIYLQQI